MTSRHPSSSGRRQKGAALLTAMVIVTMVTTIAASMVWQQWRAVQVESAERSLVQSKWILRGALDWGRLILREDGRTPGLDHLGEPWAVELAEARLSSFLAADKDNTDDAPEAFMSGRITDLTGRYNLLNLIDKSSGLPDPKQVDLFKRLCEYAGLSPSLADAIAAALRKAVLASVSDNAEMLEKLGGASARDAAPVMPQTVDQMVWLGLDAGTIERLRPFVVLLPESTAVNINTAPREVLAAVLAPVGGDLSRADRIIQHRQRNPFKSPDDLKDVLGNVNLSDVNISVASDFFQIQGRLRLQDRVVEQQYVVKRNGNEVKILFENRYYGVESVAAAKP
ncbi:MAG: general secretion pathway protein GspK [Rubrivivax sp.]|nr:MAG: general secretion pathway protein GspK [Rubrivivax sp.]